jgi:serine protease AprX
LPILKNQDVKVMKTIVHSTWRRAVFTIAILCFTATCRLHGQIITYSYYYRVYLKDKGENNTGNFAPSDLLSSRAIARRNKAHITVPDYRDLPVYEGYVNQITSKGFKLHCTSKWMNTALFKTQSKADTKPLLDLPFVSDVKIVKIPGVKGRFNDKLDFSTMQADLPPFDRPVTMVNGYDLQNSGFDGKDILIAVLDGGFLNADRISSINELRSRNGILATYDFVNNNDLVYNANNHGTAVLSVLSGTIPGSLAGTAPGADYLLLKTEDVFSEFPCEEDFWAAGAEFADSAGADIISSSLGYYNFDDPTLNYKYSDLDGNTAFVTKVADIAASKGIIVVNSAGNERNKDWKRILFPSDGDSVISVGAVDGYNIISDFSSAGPSADRRIKPDNVTMGVSVPVQTSENSVTRSSGTSFSCPILSGMAACLLQAVPQALNYEIIEVLHKSADRYTTPDSLYGYGIPDMAAALILLQDKYIKVPDDQTIAFPNPTKGDFEIIFRKPPDQITIEIVSMTGRLIFRKEFPVYSGRTISITELNNREQGIYFIRLITGDGIMVHKIIKLRD